MKGKRRHGEWLAVRFACAVVCAGMAATGCRSEEGGGDRVLELGRPVQQKIPVRPTDSFDDSVIGEIVSVEGELVKQCPGAGCWFIVRDGTGELFIDLNPARLRLKRKREGERVKVTGRLAKAGGEYRLEAEHVRFGEGDSPVGGARHVEP